MFSRGLTRARHVPRARWGARRRARLAALLAVPALAAAVGVAVASPAAALAAGPLDAGVLPTAAFPVPMPGGDTTSRIARAAAWARAPRWRAQADDPASLLVVVNKQRPLRPSEYRPSALRHVDGVELRDDAARALSRLLRAADRAGAPLIAHSGFRSYESQVSTYHRWVRNLGVRSADSQSARAGFSEHQTGLAVDMLPRGGSCHELGCFGRTRQAAWLAAHATEFGFVVRYGQGQEAVTGYTAEPWHLRYLGRQAAADVRASGAASLEEYLGLPAAPGY